MVFNPLPKLHANYSNAKEEECPTYGEDHDIAFVEHQIGESVINDESTDNR